MTKQTLLVMAGGTGGHVFPGLAVAKQLESEGWRICWLGTKDRMEASLVPQHGFPIEFIDIAGVRGNGLKRLLMAPFRIIKSIRQARKVIKKEQPDLVLGMGGFASGPGGIAAWSKGIPLVLHEQNAAAGLTNRILARFANKVLMAFPGTFKNAELVGNPVRKEVVALAGIRAREQKVGLNLLILGGSLGARVLNETLPLVLSNIANEKINVWHQTGKGNSTGVKQAYQDNENHQIEVDDFIQDMAKAYEWADLVICRAGALTVSELGVAGVPAIFVPLPFAVDDHQTKNAQSLVNVGAAELMAQSGLTPELLAERISVLSRQRDKLAEMARQAQAHSIADATEKVAGICKALVKK